MTKKICAKRAKTSPFFVALFVLLAIYSLMLVGLLVWAMISSLKAPRDFQTNPVGLPEKIVNNFAAAIKLYKIQVGGIKGQPLYAMFPQMLYNSVMYSVGCALINTAVTCITAYCCARYKYNLSRIVYVVVLVKGVRILVKAACHNDNTDCWLAPFTDTGCSGFAYL